MGGIGGPSQVLLKQEGLTTSASLKGDGRVDICVRQRNQRLSTHLETVLHSVASSRASSSEPHPGLVALSHTDELLLPVIPLPPPPPLNIVIQVVGSRGDVQPFVGLGLTLKKSYGHRVRIATHATFQSLVEDNDLEFFNIGGDPSELMAFMVRNPGLMPGLEAMRNGDVGGRRDDMSTIFDGCWRSCIEASDTPDSASDPRPFVADAIIANPPSFAHIHCAEKLGIPIHIMFTRMPYSPTRAFSHPLANITSSDAGPRRTNLISFALIELLTWRGLGDLINNFREKTLGLEPVSLLWAPGVLTRLKIPTTYCWSPSLIPKPKDWGSHISVSGFYFLPLASKYTPQPDLMQFLESGPSPIYIGFGSIVVDDPDALTTLVFEAVRRAGVRALVSKGWGGLGAETFDIPKDIFMIENVPHDWLFPRVEAVVHHGGAGTTAAGIAAGKPTVVVPFFGDQQFWGAMVAKAGAGPQPMPFRNLTAERLAAQILDALKPEVSTRAHDLKVRIAREDGCKVGVRNFHEHLGQYNSNCSLIPSRVAVWREKHTGMQLSALAATVLVEKRLLSYQDLVLYRAREYDLEDRVWEPLSGGASAILGSFGSLIAGFVDIPVQVAKPFRTSRRRDRHHHHGAHHGEDSLKRDVSAQSQSSNLAIAGKLRPTNPFLQDSLQYETDQDTLCNKADSRRSSTSEDFFTPRGMDSRLRRDGALAGVEKTADAIVQAGKGVAHIMGVSLKSPMTFSLGITRGFQNIPKLYGDKTVRKPERVTDLASGLNTAMKEFGFGFFDGITGVITQPLRGAKEGGAIGFTKGVAKGLGGLILKPGAGIFGLPGYSCQGVYKEIQKQLGKNFEKQIINARIAQGREEYRSANPQDHLEIIRRWHYL